MLDRLEAGLGDGDGDDCRTEDDGGVYWEDGGVHVVEVVSAVVDGTIEVSSELVVGSIEDSSVLESEFGSDHQMTEEEEGSGVHQKVVDCCAPSVSQSDILCDGIERWNRG